MYPVQTSDYLTYFELSRLAGIVELQLQENKTSVIDHNKTLHEQAVDIVLNKETDIVIRRTLPGGTYEDVSLKNLETSHLKI
tara:strand:+ start:6795 stop:7040 length:246 start_codon:yes stop_codon:yes gene_type:complete